MTPEELAERLREHAPHTTDAIAKMGQLAAARTIEDLASEVEALRSVVRTVAAVLDDPLFFSDERRGRAVQRALEAET